MATKIVKIVFLITMVIFFSSCSSDYKNGNAQGTLTTENWKYNGVNVGPKKGSETKKYKIGTTLLGLKYAYISELKTAIKKEAEKQGIELLIYDADGIAKNQIKNVSDMINKKVDAIILNPVDAVECSEAVDLAYNANIPVIGLCTTVNSDKLISYIGSNDVEAGKFQMNFIAEYISGKGNIVIITGTEGQSSQMQRTEGINKILPSYPQIKILASVTGNWKREDARLGMEGLLKKCNENNENIDAVICQNDEMALGAVEALDAKLRNRNVPVIGVDAIPDALKSIKEGMLQATVFQDAYAQGKTAVDVTTNYLNGEKVAKIYYIPFKLITKENVNK